MKFLVIFLLILVVFVLVIALYNHTPKEVKLTQDKNISLFQGAVPEGYDLEYFRHTGITKPLEEKK